MIDEELPPTTPGDVAYLWAAEQVTTLLDGQPETPIPEYGTAEWLQLAQEDPRRPAAVITAAEQWRQHFAEQARLDRLADEDPEEWYRQLTEDADEQARRSLRHWQLSRLLTWRELAARRRAGASHELKPTPGWPPIAVPGHPGRYLTYSGTENAA